MLCGQLLAVALFAPLPAVTGLLRLWQRAFLFQFEVPAIPAIPAIHVCSHRVPVLHAGHGGGVGHRYLSCQGMMCWWLLWQSANCKASLGRCRFAYYESSQDVASCVHVGCGAHCIPQEAPLHTLQTISMYLHPCAERFLQHCTHHSSNRTATATLASGRPCLPVPTVCLQHATCDLAMCRCVGLIEGMPRVAAAPAAGYSDCVLRCVAQRMWLMCCAHGVVGLALLLCGLTTRQAARLLGGPLMVSDNNYTQRARQS